MKLKITVILLIISNLIIAQACKKTHSDAIVVDTHNDILDDVTNYPLITKALLEKGYSEKNINKILGGNLIRVLKANEVK